MKLNKHWKFIIVLTLLALVERLASSGYYFADLEVISGLVSLLSIVGALTILAFWLIYIVDSNKGK